MKNLFFTAAYLVAFVLSGMAQPFPLNSSSSLDNQTTVDVKTERGYVYVLASFIGSTTIESVTINTGSQDRGYYVAKYNAASGALDWVHYSYGNGNSSDHIAVDFEVRNGFIHILTEAFPGSSLLGYDVQTLDNTGTVISGPSTVPGGTEQDVICIDQNGFIQNTGGLVTASSINTAWNMNNLSTPASPIDLEALTIENVNGATDIFIGGHNLSDRDAFIGRFNYVAGSGNYEPASTAGGTNPNYSEATPMMFSNNRINAIEYHAPANAIFATGQFDQADPVQVTLPLTGPSDAFVMEFAPSALNSPNSSDAAGTAGNGSGNAIDVANINQVGTVYAIGITGDAEGDLTNWGPTTNTINNAFVTLFNYDVAGAPPSFIHQWTHVLDYGGPVQEGSGTGVVFSEMLLHASGEFDGSSFDIFGGGCPQTSSLGNTSSYLVSFDRPTGTCVQSGVTESNFPNHTAVDIAYDVDRLFVAGDYEEFFTQHTAIIPPVHPHPNPGTAENYVARYDVLGSNYFKNGEATGKESVEENAMAFNLMPNPSTGVVNIHQEIEDVMQVQVSDMNGRVVLEKQLVYGITAIDLSFLPKRNVHDYRKYRIISNSI